MLTQVSVKQLTDFLRTVTAASDLVDCTLVNCENVTRFAYNFLRYHERFYRTIGPLVLSLFTPFFLFVLSMINSLFIINNDIKS